MYTKKVKILCTIGPSSFDLSIIKRLDELGVDLFRINLSHTKVGELDSIIKHIKRGTRIPICLDTEGAQVRTGNFIEAGTELRENSTIKICANLVPGDQLRFNLTPISIVSEIVIGDFISIDFNSVLVMCQTLSMIQSRILDELTYMNLLH